MCSVCAFIHRNVDPDTEKKYLGLEELGFVLKKLSSALPRMYTVHIYKAELRRYVQFLISYSCHTIKKKFP